MKAKDKRYLKLTIENSKKSAEKALFPAGAVVVQNNKVVSSDISAVFPDFRHSESKVIDEAFEKIKKPLSDCTLYCSMEPCLMCLGRAYWAGIKRIVFACSKQAVSQYYFENCLKGQEIVENFHKCVEFVHYKDLEVEAWRVVKDWEQNSESVESFMNIK